MQTFDLGVKPTEDVVSTTSTTPEATLPSFDLEVKEIEDTVFDFNGQAVSGSLIDGDTVQWTDPAGKKQSLRFGFGDAGETAKITPDGLFSAGSYAGATQFDEISKLAKSMGYNKIVTTGKDRYDRYVGDLENAAGEKFSEKLITENIVKPSMYLGKGVQDKQYDLIQKKGLNSNAAWLNSAEQVLTPYEQASEIIQSIVQDSPQMQRTMSATSDELMFGSRAYGRAIKAKMKSLERIINDPSQDAETISESKAQYEIAQESLQLNMNYDNTFYGSQEQMEQAYKRRIKGSPGTFAGWHNSAKRAVVNLEGSAASFTQWSGDLVNNKSWESWGEDWAENVEEKYSDINTAVDLFDIRGPGDAFKWTTETAIEFAPQLALVYAGGKGGAMAGGAIGSAFGGVGAAPGAVIGGIVGAVGTGFVLVVGQIYNSMPEGEKNPHTAAGLGLAVGAVDAFGMKGAGLAARNILTKEGKELFVDAMVAEGKAESKEAAQLMLKKHVAETLHGSGSLLQDFAQKQMLKRQGFEAYIKSSVRAAGREGATEGLQEIISQGGVAALTSKEIDWNELAKDITRNAAAGGLVGGGFDAALQGRVTGGLESLNDVNAIISAFAPESNDRSKVSRMEERQREVSGGKESVESVAKRTAQESQVAGTEGLTSTASFGSGSIKAGAKAFFKNPLSAFKSMDRKINKFAFNKFGGANDNMQKAIGLISRDPIYTGTSVTSEIDYQRGQIVSTLPSLNEAFSLVGAKNQKDFEAILEQTDGLTPEQEQGKIELQSRIDEVSENIAVLMEKAGDTGTITAKEVREGALVRLNMYNGKKVDAAFVTALTGQTFTDVVSGNKYIVDKELAEGLADRIREGKLSMGDVNIIESTQASQDPAFRAKYNSQNTIASIINTSDKLISDSVLTQRFGRDGSSLVYLFKKAKSEGEISEAEYQESIDWAKSLMSVYQGNFQKINDPRMRAVNNSLITVTTLRLMDMNAFANVGEMFYGTIGLSGKDKVKYFGRATKAFLQGIFSDYYSIPAEMGAPYTPLDVRDLGNKELNRLLGSGHVLTGNEILYMEGVNTSDPRMQKVMKIFYKINLVSAQANAMRGARMSFAWPSILKLLDKVRVDGERGNISDTGRWARDRLNSYGLDPDRLNIFLDKYMDVDIDNLDFETLLMDPDEASFLTEQVRLANINFTDEFSARPQPGSTPAIFESEVFRPFTQFKRFLAHVTANITPNLWQNYIKTAPPGTSYNTFSSIMTIVATAYIAQAFKDSVAYGETPEWIEDEDEDFFRSATYRAISYTGFLGTPELLLEELNSIWTKGAQAAANGESAFGAMALESTQLAPSLSLIQSDVKAFNKGGERSAERLVGMIPFAGSLYNVKTPLVDLLMQGNQEK